MTVISWESIRPFSLTVGLMVLPKAISYYRSIRASNNHGVAVRPVPSNVSRALFILFATALAFIIKSFPQFAPENIFALTQSRLQIPTDVLFTRLLALRPMGLTAADEVLRSRFSSIDSRLLFFQYGPDVLADCQFCNADDPKSYLYYAMPSILAPHLFNLCVLAAVTSGLFIGREGAVWRTTATMAAAGAAIVDISLVNSYNQQGNSRATRLGEVDRFFWTSRVYRYLAIAAIDGVIGWMLYLSSTNRAFRNPPSTVDRVANSSQILDGMRSKLNALAILRNTINRDEKLRAAGHKYWVHEGALMREVLEDRDVLESVNDAIENRLDMKDVEENAGMYAHHIVGLLGGQEVQAQPNS